jgi:hypothetical protein
MAHYGTAHTLSIAKKKHQSEKEDTPHSDGTGDNTVHDDLTVTEIAGEETHR